MKKLFALSLGLLVSVCVFAQQPKSQRLVLIEEFTNASCGPCAAANPAFNTLLNNNATKTVAIKYQTDWPGVDPMNAQNAAEVDTRVSYYGITGVPHAQMDGQIHDAHPNSFTQAWIDSRYAVSSPFTMTLTHMLSPDYDSIFISCTITATQASTFTGPLKGHVVIEENEIHFCSAPGANGEKDFFDVMRKMLPDASGTTLPLTWANGDAQTLQFAVPLPSYIYDKNQICVVAFVQNNSDTIVQQAAYSPPQPLVNDATLPCSALSGVPLLQCTNTFTPSVTIKNAGSATLTAADIYYKIDNGTASVYNWTGSIASGATAVATLPVVTGTAGAHTFIVYITNPNGNTDYNFKQDTAKAPFTISPANASTPLTEGFTSTVFPPNGLMVYNPDNDSYTWSRSTAGVAPTATGSAALKFYYIPDGLFDELMLPPISSTGLSSLSLGFDLAHAMYNSSYSDRLEVYVSSDCGSTWTSVYDKSDPSLATTANSSSSYTPSAASQWRNEVVSLNSYLGQAQLFIKFKGTSGYGNNLYIDNINLSESSGIKETQTGNNSVTVYPNPFRSETMINLNLAQQSDVNISVYNVLGECVFASQQSNMNSGMNQITFSGSGLPAGVYFVKAMIGNELQTIKVTLEK